MRFDAIDALLDPSRDELARAREAANGGGPWA
jgi:hypothetical protein